MNYKRIIDKHFEGMVGQEIARRRISNTLLGAKLQDGFMAPTLIVAPPGIGKTHLLNAVKRIYKDFWGDERKAISCPSGDELGGVTEFFEDVLVSHVHDKKACFFIDEFHKASKGVQSLFHSMIEITAARTPKLVRKADYECLVNPLNHGFIFATNRVEEIDPALLSRLDRIDLSLYNDTEMEQILFLGLESDGIVFYDNTLRKIAECNRGTARDVVKWIESIRLHLAIKGLVQGKKLLNKQDVSEIIKGREAFPLGVSKNELNTLLLLDAHGEMQMKQLAARNLCGSPAEQNANERYLLQRGLIEIDVLRKLSKEGREYLAQLRKEGFIP
jgi:Holliday junction resolvasome RuvABC ATP-dependent DNA helicase subunit